MDIPAPYEYETETFDRDRALKHVLDYPAFQNALTNHSDALQTYLWASGRITGYMCLTSAPMRQI